ncbi:aminotransferase [Gluconobacter wancherniae]|uniref:Aminotransferase n=1 Tax=Gluconobacter wancherniae NBRC 103581 TaxID=656744 RepID=A0A511B9C7_9PROT|nr:aminotransferase [Gluconobacter wancherniae]MBF0854559.1 aminotransferase [Gluconobacter wancherniae]GBD57715.1 aminotransferase [Gluconobacter wancherniae NBRC 103581]GBR62373.1 transaminase [Gluconobacter wancherniae NBRC 103581]GEK94427.1 aminotransferase [Gluconobacter wancherniae NBRC 103581]
MKSPNRYLSELPTTIFTIMSQLAVKHDAVNLGQGFPDTEGPAELIEVAAAALKDNRNQYAPLTGLPELRQAVAASNMRFYGLDIDPATEVVVTSGATEALAACLMAVIEPGDEVVLIEPLYDTYLPALKLLGATAKCVRLQPPHWSLPENELRAAFGPKTKAILLNSPMNPAGKVFSEQELHLIADLVREHDVYAICDEVYEHLTFHVKHVPLMTLPGMRERCMRIGSAGKSFSLTGWKVGYVTAPAALASVIAKAHQVMVFATAPNLQRAVAHGLNMDDTYFQQLSADLEGRRDLLRNGLHDLGFSTLPADGSYFIVADISRHAAGRNDVEFARWLVEHAGVATIPVSAFYDPNGPEAPQNLIRFAFCKQPHVLEEALKRMRAALT